VQASEQGKTKKIIKGFITTKNGTYPWTNSRYTKEPGKRHWNEKESS